MRKIFSLLLCAAMTMSVYAGSFGLAGKWYDTDADATGIAAALDAIENVTASGTISYDAATSTLTLDNASIECASDKDVIKFGDNTTLTIKLVGNNTIAQTNTSEYKSGIYLDGTNQNITITGAGKLTVTSYQYIPIRIASSSLTFDNTTIEAYTTKASTYDGIGHNSEGGNLVIKNSCVKATQISYLASITLTDCQILQPKEEEREVDNYTYGAGKAIVRSVSGNLAYDIAIYPQTFTVDDVVYKLYDVASGNRQVCVPQQDYTSAALIIPDSVMYESIKFQVHHINSIAFRDNASITSVDLKCEEIWSSAFESCINLETVTLQEGVKKITSYAFSEIKATSIHLPASLTNLADGAASPFCYNKFTEITIAEGNTGLVVGEDGAVYDTDKTTLMAYPYEWTGAKFARVPESVTRILGDAFRSCQHVADTLVLPENLTRAETAFSGASMKCVILNSTNLNNVFQSSSDLQEIIIGKKVNYIGELMFYRCSGVRKITILSPTMPNWFKGTNTGWPSFGDNGDVFTECKVYVHCGQSATYAADANKWANFTNIIDTLLYDVNVIAENATYEVEKLSACSEVKVTVTPNSGYSFVNWDNGETESPLTLTVISDTTIRANIKKNLVEDDLFTAKSAEGIDIVFRVMTNEPGSKTVSVGYKSNYSPYTNTAIDNTTAGALTIPEKAQYFDEEYDVVEIGPNAFYQCTGLTKIAIPGSVKKIDRQAFYKCTALATVSLSEGLENLVYGAFEYCPITSITLPNSLTHLGAYTFYSCQKLRNVNIPDGIDYIDELTFAYNYVLETITIPSSVKYIDYIAFNYCMVLGTINWTPANIERLSNSFSGTAWQNNIVAENGGKYTSNILLYKDNDVSGLTEFTVKAGTRIIAAGAMQSMSSVQTISIPASVTAIGENAFLNATALQRCTLETVLPPAVFNMQKVKQADKTANDLFGRNPFIYAHMEGSTYVPDHWTYNESLLVYVPKAAVAAFKSHDQWKMMNIRPIGGWTVTFKDYNGNDIIAPQQVEQGEAAVKPASVGPCYTADHMYVFANDWTIDANGGDTIYTAKYTEQDLPEYKVWWQQVEGTDWKFTKFQHGHSAVAKGAEVAAELTAPICQQFDAWSADLSSITAEIHVYPTWKEAKYTVTFKDGLNGSNIQIKNNVECHEDVDAPTAPEHSGYTFKGWDSDAYKNVTADLTITAVYESSATGIDQTTNDQRPMTNRKLLRDGQLIIERDGKFYNAQGAEVR